MTKSWPEFKTLFYEFRKICLNFSLNLSLKVNTILANNLIQIFNTSFSVNNLITVYFEISIIMATKWGVLSVGKISHVFVEAVRTFPEGDHQVSYIQNS
jgi:hypothetical protein